MTKQEMDVMTRGLPTKSAKIRLLADHGVARADIARYLEIKYQHVRNVLVAPRPREATGKDQPERGAEKTTLTIEEAKRGLARQFRVSVDAIEITIRG